MIEGDTRVQSTGYTNSLQVGRNVVKRRVERTAVMGRMFPRGLADTLKALPIIGEEL